MQYNFKFRFKLKFNGKEVKEMNVNVKAENQQDAEKKLIEAVAKKIDIDIVSAVAEVHIAADSKQDAQEKSRQHINKIFFNPQEN